MSVARVEQPAPMSENILALAVRRRAWNGVRLGVTEFRCNGRVLQQLTNGTDALLSVVVEEVGDRCEPRLRKDTPCPITYRPRQMFYAPAGLDVWGYNPDARYVKNVMLAFDLEALEQRLSTALDDTALTTPRLRFVDDPVWTLVGLLADVVDDPDPSMQLYGDGLTAAIAGRLWARRSDVPPQGSRLAPWQLRRVLDYLEACLPDRVGLDELAALTGLSQWHFSRAFKASTGMAPYRWQLEARIQRAQTLLLDTDASLEHVAEATGFADAVHFGKTFRRITGMTPAAWRKVRKR
jgi:AraC family transcriptional regulator